MVKPNNWPLVAEMRLRAFVFELRDMAETSRRPVKQRRARDGAYVQLPFRIGAEPCRAVNRLDSSLFSYDRDKFAQLG